MIRPRSHRISSTARALALFVCATVVLAGCDSLDSASPEEIERAQAQAGKGKPTAAQAESLLMLDGKAVDSDDEDVVRAAARRAVAGTSARSRTAAATEEWPELPLLPNGQIDAGADPFTDSSMQVLPIPIEDDAALTAGIDAFARQLRRVDIDEWRTWMTAPVVNHFNQDPDSVASSMVEVSVERCGGARVVASGVVLADETVVTTVHAVENASRRVRVEAAVGGGERIPAMIRYLDVDDDIAVLRVPGLRLQPLGFHVVTGTTPQFGHAYGIGVGGRSGVLHRAPVVVAMQEAVADREQPDGFAEQISDRSILPLVGAVDTGFSGGVVAATNDPQLRTGWGFHGLIRARVPFRSDTGGVVIPSRLVTAALDAADRLDEWAEIKPGGCPQWHR